MSRITEILDKIFGIPEALVDSVDQFKYLLSTDMKEYKREARKLAPNTKLKDFSE
jgi:hypothetical protein